MSIENFVETLRQQRREIMIQKAGTDLTSLERAALIKKLKDIDEAIFKATRKGITE